MASNNNPNNRKGEVKVAEGRICEFCGSDKGVHRIMRAGHGRSSVMMWACNEDNCKRFK